MKFLGLPLLITALLVGCVAGAGAYPSVPPNRITTVAAPETLGNSGVTLTPPGVMGATVDGSKAYDVCTSHKAPCPDSSPTAVRLGIANDEGPATLDASGRLNLTMKDRLVWAITWSDIECRLRGGAFVDASGSPAPAPMPKSCDTVAFVDAGTGEFLYEVTFAHS
jgi:hypothetical protein